MNPFIMQGEMLATLESEGLQEALQRRWLVPDPSTGFLLVSQEMAKVQEMREAAEPPRAETPQPSAATIERKETVRTEETWTKPWEAPPRAHNIAISHAQRDISELLSPATGHDNSSPLAARAPTSPLTTPPPSMPSTPTAPGAPAPVTAATQQKVGIGDEVLVSPPTGAAESQTYTGKVSKNENGQVTINFGTTTRQFPETQVKVIKSATGTPTAGQ
jgi:hypothetical protein